MLAWSMIDSYNTHIYYCNYRWYKIFLCKIYYLFIYMDFKGTSGSKSKLFFISSSYVYHFIRSYISQIIVIMRIYNQLLSFHSGIVISWLLTCSYIFQKLQTILTVWFYEITSCLPIYMHFNEMTRSQNKPSLVFNLFVIFLDMTSME